MKTLIFMKENDNFSVSRNSEVSAFPRRMSCLSSFAFYMDVSVQFSRSVLSDSLRPHGLQHSRPPCPSPIPGVYSNSCPLSWWCHPTISSSVIPFSFCLQSFLASGSFPMSLFTEGVKLLELQLQHQSFQWIKWIKRNLKFQNNHFYLIFQV